MLIYGLWKMLGMLKHDVGLVILLTLKIIVA